MKKEDENNFFSQDPLKFTYTDLECCRHQALELLVRTAVAASFVAAYFGNILFL